MHNELERVKKVHFGKTKGQAIKKINLFFKSAESLGTWSENIISESLSLVFEE